MIASTTIADELRLHGACASTTRGTSMRPLFKTGRDVVVIEQPTRELKKYDVVLYRYPSGKYVLHRIIRVCEDEYLIRGDNTFTVEHIPREWILGILVRFNRKGKSHSVDERGFRVYSVLWNFIYPLRLLLHKCRLLLGRVYRRLFKRKGSK